MSGNFAIKGGGGAGPLMANAILIFHFDFLNPSLTETEAPADVQKRLFSHSRALLAPTRGHRFYTRKLRITFDMCVNLCCSENYAWEFFWCMRLSLSQLLLENILPNYINLS